MPTAFTWWRYSPENGWPISPRLAPDINSSKAEVDIPSGTLLAVSNELPGEDGVLYLQLANNDGWLFDRKPGIGPNFGVMCVPHEVDSNTKERNQLLHDLCEVDTFKVNAEEIQMIESVLEEGAESLLMLGLSRFDHATLLRLVGNAQPYAERQEGLMELKDTLKQLRSNAGEALSFSRESLQDLLFEISPDRVLNAVIALRDWPEAVRCQTAHERARLAALVRLVLQHSYNMPADKAKEVESSLAISPGMRSKDDRLRCLRAVSEILQPRSSSDRAIEQSTEIVELAFPEESFVTSCCETICTQEAFLQKVDHAIVVVETLVSGRYTVGGATEVEESTVESLGEEARHTPVAAKKAGRPSKSTKSAADSQKCATENVAEHDVEVDTAAEAPKKRARQAAAAKHWQEAAAALRQGGRSPKASDSSAEAAVDSNSTAEQGAAVDVDAKPTKRAKKGP